MLKEEPIGRSKGEATHQLEEAVEIERRNGYQKMTEAIGR
jgi:hypothetical protein